MKVRRIPRRPRPWDATQVFWPLLLGFAVANPAPLWAQAPQELSEGTKALYSGQYEKARDLASKYLEAYPHDAPARILLARVEIAEGQFGAAQEALRTAVKLAPSNLDALYYLEGLCAILSQREFQKLLQTFPDSFRSHQVLAESYLAQNNKQGAEEEFQAALRANPESVDILNALGDLRRSEYKLDEALDYYGRAAKLSPGDYTSAYGAGACYLFQNDTLRAIASLKRAVSIDPESAAAHFALGDAWLRADHADTAVRELKEALRLKSDFRQAYSLLARAYQKLGMTRQAQEALARDQELARQKLKGTEEELIEEGHLPAPP